MHRLVPLFFLLYFSSVFRTNIYACASCGGSSSESIVLYPNETFKLGLSASQQSNIRNIGNDGAYYEAGGPEKKQMITFAAAYALTRNSFLGVGIPYYTNYYQDLKYSAKGDPVVSGRITILPLNFAESYRPQIQWMNVYKHSLAKSIHDTQDEETYLDVGGNGFNEIKTGLDVWWGSLPVKPGFLMAASRAFSRRFENNRTLQPGNTFQGVVSLATNIHPKIKSTVAHSSEQKLDLRINSQTIPESKTLSHWLLFTLDYLPDALTDVKLSIQVPSRIFESYNSFAATNLNLGITRAL